MVPEQAPLFDEVCPGLVEFGRHVVADHHFLQGPVLPLKGILGSADQRQGGAGLFDLLPDAARIGAEIVQGE